MGEVPGIQGYKDKPDMSMIWLRHLDRTNLSSGDVMGSYDAYVRQQLRLLPIEMRKWVLDQSDIFEEEKTYLYFKTSGIGTDLGFKDNPLVWNDARTDIGLSSDSGFNVKRLEDGSIDWADPRIYSPTLEKERDIDYEVFNNLILTAAEISGLSWKTEPSNTEYGLYPSKEDLDLGTPTPLDDPKKNEHPEQNPLHQKCWINYKGTPKLVTNFRGYACGIGENEKPWFFNELAIRQTKQKPIVIMITATQGEGKTYFGIRLGEIFDKHFDPDKQIVMSRSKILSLVSGRGGLKRNQVIIVDESQWGASAREWGNKDQLKLMKFLAAARFKGYIIIIVSLHRSMLDSIIRERIINYHIHMEERGRATVYAPTHARFDEQRYPHRKGGLILQLPDYDSCDYVSCLTCEENETCMTIRAIYERNKTAFIEGEAEKDAAEEMKQAAAEMSEKELAEMVAPVIDEVSTNTKGFYEIGDIQTALAEHYGLDISIRHATRIRGYLMKLIPPTH